MINDFHAYLLNLPLTAYTSEDGHRLLDPTFASAKVSEYVDNVRKTLFWAATTNRAAICAADALYVITQSDYAGAPVLAVLDPRVTPVTDWTQLGAQPDVAAISPDSWVVVDSKLQALGLYTTDFPQMPAQIQQMLRAPVVHRRLAGAALFCVWSGKMVRDLLSVATARRPAAPTASTTSTTSTTTSTSTSTTPPPPAFGTQWAPSGIEGPGAWDTTTANWS